MATILQFKALRENELKPTVSAASADLACVASVPATAEIVFFPGVRYERQAEPISSDVVADTGKKPSKKKRDGERRPASAKAKARANAAFEQVE
jgi:hypothetical protein